MIPSNERGSALIITLMLLLILTAIGIYAISISTTEMSIALQSKMGTATLNSADSGAHFGIDKIPVLSMSLPPAMLSGTLWDNSSYNWSSWMTGTMSLKAGYGSNYRFADFGVSSTGTPPTSFVGQRTVQAVANFGPVPVGTMY